jgi:hypothetical protein
MELFSYSGFCLEKLRKITKIFIEESRKPADISIGILQDAKLEPLPLQ